MWSGHLAFGCSKGSQNVLRELGQAEEVNCSPKLSRDLVKRGGRDLQFTVGSAFRAAPRSSLRAVSGKSNTDSRPAVTSAA